MFRISYLQAFKALARAFSELNRTHRIVKVHIVAWERADLLGMCQLRNCAVSEDGRKFTVPSILFEDGC